MAKGENLRRNPVESQQGPQILALVIEQRMEQEIVDFVTEGKLRPPRNLTGISKTGTVFGKVGLDQIERLAEQLFGRVADG